MSATESVIASVSLWSAEPPTLRHLDPPQRLFVPLASRPNAAARPKPPGTQVSRGEALVEAAVESAHIALAPTAGTIGQPMQVSLTNGRVVPAVEFFARQIESPSVELSGVPDLVMEPLTAIDGPAALVEGIERLRKAGVSADRNASPDLIAQLNHVVSHPIEQILCNIMDTDPGVRLNAALAAQNARDVIAGVSHLAHLTGAREMTIAIETAAAAGWTMPVRAAAQAAGVRIVDLPNDYPQSDPTLMLYSVAARRLRPGQLPVTQKVLLVDAAAALAVAQAAAGMAALQTPLAIHDQVHRRVHFLSVAVGTPLRDILERLRIPAEYVMLRGGDLLRDIRLRPDAVAGGAELILHVTPPEFERNPEPCIRCGWCLQTCPTRVQPAALLDAAQRNDRRMAERSGINACIECGLCTHVCPSHLPIADAIRKMRNSG